MTSVRNQDLECDILVAGGGPAGVCCALAAARLGAKVILCQDRSMLGGNASSEIRMHIVGATGLRGGTAFETELREGGIVEEIRLELAVHNPQRSAAMMDLILYDKCRREKNITLLLNTTVDGAEVAGGLVRRALATRPSTEDRFRIAAKTFVDCTGDGRLGLEAGAPFRHGREAAHEFGERLAVADADTRTLGSTILFQAKRHDRPMPFTPPPWIRRFRAEDFKLRPFGRPGFDLGLEYGYWWAEWGGCLDTIKDNERIRDELLAIVLGIWHHIKNESGQPVGNWALDWFGFVPGKRESRRFEGLYMLSERDVLQSRSFPDAIAYGGWPIDTHPPEGVDAPDLPPCEQHHVPYLYDIPLRACISRGPRNLMFAGRNISATHIAFASTRVMATCAAMGQGVGTAAAIALSAGVVASDIPGRSDLLDIIQQRLLRDDCYLVGVKNTDELDLVRRAGEVAASSELPDAGAEQIRSGQTRSVHGSGGGKSGAPVTCAPPDRARPALHRWMSDPRQSLPAWLSIAWTKEVEIGRVVLVFDTGLQRILTLSQADGYTAMMEWGRPQPETVRDYTIEAMTEGGWKTIESVTGNYQRRREHVFGTAVKTRSLRVSVTATNGIDHARIFEIRAYPPESPA